jgi:RNA binding exosome subunit
MSVLDQTHVLFLADEKQRVALGQRELVEVADEVEVDI